MNPRATETTATKPTDITGDLYAFICTNCNDWGFDEI